MATIPVNSFSSPIGVAVNPAGTRVYVTSNGSGPNSVSVIDTSSNTVLATINVAIRFGLTLPSGIAVNPAGTRLYVTNYVVSHSLSVIDTSSNTVIATVGTGGFGPFGIAVNPAGTRVYVANENSNNVVVIDTSTNTIIANITGVGTTPFGVSINPAGTRVYVTNRGSNSVSVIDTSSNAVVATVGVGVNPESLGISIGPGTSSLPQTPAPPTLVLTAVGIAILALYWMRLRSRAA